MAEISLAQIVSLISDTVGQPFNIPLQEKLKVIVAYKRANYLQQSLEKHPEQRKFFQQSFTTKLTQVAAGDCVIPNVTCPILKSVCSIPYPLRSSWSMFDYVGTPDWTTAWGEIVPEFNNLRSYNRYTKDLTKWCFINGDLYVFNNLRLKMIGIRGIFSDPYAINTCCSTGNCFTDDTPFPMPADLINAMIRDILNTELKVQYPQLAAVDVPEEKKVTRPTEG
jgi:hypothetical protein